MTTPAEPTENQPVEDQQQPDQNKTAPDNPDGGKDWQAEADRWKAYSRKHEDDAKALKKSQADLTEQLNRQQALTAKLAEATGIQLEDDQPDPDKLQAQLAKAQAESAQRAAELAITRKAQAAGLDPDVLLDSRAFMSKATAPDADVDELVNEAATSGRYTPPAPKTPPAAKSGGNYTGAPAENRQLTKAEAIQLAQSDPGAFEKARKNGLLEKLGWGR